MIHNIKKIAFAFQVFVLLAMLPTYAYLELSHSTKGLPAGNNPSVVIEMLENPSIKIPGILIYKIRTQT
jgi:hypothetical protein